MVSSTFSSWEVREEGNGGRRKWFNKHGKKDILGRGRGMFKSTKACKSYSVGVSDQCV